ESMNYGPTPPWFMLSADFETPLPILKIDTGGEHIPDEPKIDGQMGIIWHDDGTPNASSDLPNEFLGPIAIERRGQTSLYLFPKNGYGFETRDENGEDVDVAFLNFPEEEDWVLHGPYSDKTLLRNILAMELARSTGQYASRTRMVELFINEQYEGVYVLMERIKRDNNRVDIANLREEDISGDELTGGYVFKIDKGEHDWLSQYDIAYNPGAKLRFQYVSPRSDQIQPEQEAYLQSYVDSFETALVLPDGTFGGKHYSEYIDVVSFADHFLISELTKEVDAYRISSFYHKDKDSKGGLLKAGPVWDFNLAFGNADYCNAANYEGWMYSEHCDAGNPFWWETMWQDDAFRDVLKCRWEEFRAGPFHLDTIFAFIDQQTALAAPALERNFQRWPVLDQYIWPNAVVTGSYEQEVLYVKNFIAGRIAWMDQNIPGDCTITDTVEATTVDEIKIYPNPARNYFSLESNAPLTGTLNIQLVDMLGKPIWVDQQYSNWQMGTSFLTIDLQKLNLAAGVYFVQLRSDNLRLKTCRLIVE
ncbi:MAG: CotH kinase family protein, partial [Bacteroidota bacterium]